MTDQRFPILGSDIPRLLGRNDIMAGIWRNLTKTTPSNLSLVGGRYIGKTVIMNALARQVVEQNSSFAFVLHWHLGHVSPISDDDFITQLCKKLRACLAESEKDMSDYRGYLEDGSFAELREVMDVLDDESMPILMLWDGFDKPLGQGKLSGHLWDQMRSLFYGGSHKIVTATRKPLRELIRNEDAITSPFWNIFDINPVRIPVFDPNDCDAVLAELPDYQFQPGALTEMISWTSGLPPLFLGVLNQLIRDLPGRSVSCKLVNHAAMKALDTFLDIVSDVWQDCPEGAKDLYLRLMAKKEISSSEAGRWETECLVEKGFARKSASVLKVSCRMLEKHIQRQGQHTSSMAHLFGTWEAYQSNIRSLLERRLSHISRFDDRLYRLVERAIVDIPDYPDDCLNNLNGIRDRALQLIWQKEFSQENKIPAEVIAYWTSGAQSRHKLVKQMMDEDCWNPPVNPLEQIRLLALLTGSFQGFESKAKAVSKDTYVLIDAIHNFRNRGIHPDGQSLHVGVAVAALMACLELLGCLDRELKEFLGPI